MNVNRNILCFPLSEVPHMEVLFNRVCDPALSNVGKKTDTGWIFDSEVKFMNDPHPHVNMFNNMTHNARVQGYSYIFITFK